MNKKLTIRYSRHANVTQNQSLQRQLAYFLCDLKDAAEKPDFNLESKLNFLQTVYGLSVQVLKAAAMNVHPQDHVKVVAACVDAFDEAFEGTLEASSPCLSVLRNQLVDATSMLIATNDPHAPKLAPYDLAGWNNLLMYHQAALKVEVSLEATPPKRVDYIMLSRSQRESLAKLQSFYAIKKHGARVAGTDARPIPLIVGPSGTGKTALVRHFADTSGLPMMDFCSGTWLPSGARSQPNTLESMRNFIEAHDSGVIFIDELDKFSADQDYYRSVQQEVYALLDGRLSSFAGWNDAAQEKCRQKFFIVGAGTWQDMFKAERKSIGFGNTDTGAPINLDDQTVIPEELLMRFNARILFLSPPSALDFHDRFIAIHEALKMPRPSPARLQKLVTRAVASNKHNRAVEAYLNFLMEKKLREPWVIDDDKDATGAAC